MLNEFRDSGRADSTGETPYQRLQRMMAQQDFEQANGLMGGFRIAIRVVFSAISSDVVTIGEIENYITKGEPFALKDFRSTVIFIPTKLKAYWLWADGSTGPIFSCSDMRDFIQTVAMQYLVHKELVSQKKLLKIVKQLMHA